MTEQDLIIQDLRRENEQLKSQLNACGYTMAHIVTELCPHCETEVEMSWCVEAHGYKAYCPYCGKRLMLCDECQHPNGEYCGDCDYSSEGDCCRYNPEGGGRNEN